MGRTATLCRYGIASFALFSIATGSSVAGTGLPIPQSKRLSFDALQYQQPVVSLTNVVPQSEYMLALNGSVVAEQVRTPKVLLPTTQEGEPGVLVGTTYYDFQTNGSMPNRITYLEDLGDKYVQMVWMAATSPSRDATSGALGMNNTRGSYYTYLEVNDPDAPQLLIENWQKLEDPVTERTGWPSLIQLSSGAAATPSHTPVKFHVNGGLGDPLFFGNPVATAADSALWPRAAVSLGDQLDIMHLVYNRATAANVNQVVYRRSSDGAGALWGSDVFFTGPNGLGASPGSPLVDGGGGDTYAMTARGNTVAVVYRDAQRRLILRKSYDAGVTWPLDSTGARVLYIPDESRDSVDLSPTIREYRTDTLTYAGTNMDIILDSDGMAHVVVNECMYYIRGRHAIPRPAGALDTIYSVADPVYFRDRGILYMQEGRQEIARIGLPSGTGWDGVGRYINRRVDWGMSAQPQLGIDGDDNIYMVYTAPKNGDVKDVSVDTTGTFVANEPDTLTTVAGLNMHIWATHKLSGFDVWSEPKDLTPVGVNAQWATLCDDVVGGVMYIGYAANLTPGDHVTNSELPDELTNVYMYAMKTSNLNLINSVAEAGDRGLKADVTIAPNPSATTATLTIDTQRPGVMTVSLVNVLGDMVLRLQSPDASGTWSTAIPTANLAAGTYHCVIEQGGVRTSRMLTVMH